MKLAYMSKLYNRMMKKIVLALVVTLGLSCSLGKTTGDAGKGNMNGDSADLFLDLNAVGESIPQIVDTKVNAYNVDLLYDSVNFQLDCEDEFIEEDGSYSFTALGLACKKGNITEVISLLNSGACIETCLADMICFYDLLYTAFAFDQFEMIEFILDKKLYSDVDKIYTENGTSPLYLACRISKNDLAIKTVRQLLQNGADVNGAVKENFSGEFVNFPIIGAFYNDNVKLVELLLAEGADVSIIGREGLSVGQMVTDYGSDEMQELFRQFDNIE